jgi:hypothetical protein
VTMSSFLDLDSPDIPSQLRVGDCPETCHYPTAHDWRVLADRSPFFQRICDELARGPVALVGTAGTGKSFHLLLVGRWWIAEGRCRSGLWARVAQLDLERVQEQFRDTGHLECLWLLDDVHEEPEKAQILVDSFVDQGLHYRKHALVMGGLNMPKLRWPTDWGPVRRVELQVTEGTVASAVLASRLPELPPEIMPCLAVRGANLRRILAVARACPSRLGDAKFMRRGSADDAAGKLGAALFSRFSQLLRLTALGMWLPKEVPTGLYGHLRTLSKYGFVVDRAGWQIGTEDLAIAVLQREADQAGPCPALSEVFLAPLRGLVRELLEAGLMRTVVLLLQRLATVTEAQLWERLGYPANQDAGSPLLHVFLADRTTADSLLEAAAASFGSPKEFSRLLALLERFGLAPGPDAKRGMLSQQVLWGRGLAAGDIEMTLAALRLSLIASDEMLLAETRAALSSPSFVDSFIGLQPAARAAVLRRLAHLDQPACQTFLQALIPRFYGELKTRDDRAIWNALASMARVDARAAADLLRLFSPSEAARLVLSMPSRARSLAALLRGTPDAFSTYRGLFHQIPAILRGPITVGAWESPWEAVSLVNLAHSLAMFKLLEHPAVRRRVAAAMTCDSPGLILELEHATRHVIRECPILVREIATTLELAVKGGQPPLGARLYALTRLRRPRARPYVKAALAAELVSPGNAIDLFRLLFEALVALDALERGSAVTFAERVAEGWLGLFPGDQDEPVLLSLAGLAAFVRGKPPTAFVPSFTWFEGLADFRPWSPTATVSQFYWLSLPGDTSVAKYRLRWADFLGSPSKEFHRRWLHGFNSRGRRILLEILAAALENLHTSNIDPSVVKGLVASVATEDQDTYWDYDTELRLKVIIRLGDPHAAIPLIARRSQWWAARLPSLRVGPIVRLSELLLNLTGMVPDARTVVGDFAQTCLREKNVAPKALAALERLLDRL